MTAKSLRAWTVTFIALVGLIVAGHWLGRRLAQAGVFAGSGKGAGVGSREASVPERPRAGAGTVRRDQVTAAMSRLKTLLRNSPDLNQDWEALAAVEQVLAGLTGPELQAVYEGLDPASSAAERLLSWKVGGRWMAADPDGAFKAIAEKLPGKPRLGVIMAYTHWAQEDPVAAMAWLKTAGLEPLGESVREDFQRVAVSRMIDVDPAAACAGLSGLEGENLQSVLSTWGEKYVDDPAMREELVARLKETGRPEDYARFNESLLRVWPQEDSLGMLHYLQDLKGYLESDAVPAASRPEVDAAAVGIAIYREYTRPALEWWMERYSQSAETPPPLQQAVYNWVHKEPQVVEQWFAEQPDSPQKDALRASTVSFFTTAGDFAKAAAGLEQIQDPALREKWVERLDRFWTATNPEAAGEWRAKRAGSGGGE